MDCYAYSTDKAIEEHFNTRTTHNLKHVTDLGVTKKIPFTETCQFTVSRLYSFISGLVVTIVY